MNVRKRLKELSKDNLSSWSKDADFRIKNRKWLRYSNNIARRVLAAIEDKKESNQKTLADNIGVTPQYISKIVKGKENLTLETIAKLSEALNMELITFPEYKYSTGNSYSYPFYIPYNAMLYATGIIWGVQIINELNREEIGVRNVFVGINKATLAYGGGWESVLKDFNVFNTETGQVPIVKSKNVLMNLKNVG